MFVADKYPAGWKCDCHAGYFGAMCDYGMWFSLCRNNISIKLSIIHGLSTFTCVILII